MGTQGQRPLNKHSACLTRTEGSRSRTHHHPRLEWDQRSIVGCGQRPLTLLRQPQEQHVAVRAPSPAGGRSHFELVVLAPAEAPELRALRASQQGLCPRGCLASWHRLGPEQRRVGLGRGSRAADLGESPEKGGGFRDAVRSGPGTGSRPGRQASPSS